MLRSSQAIHLPAHHLNATESFAALQDSSQILDVYNNVFWTCPYQYSSKSRIETSIRFSLVFNHHDGAIDVSLPTDPVSLS